MLINSSSIFIVKNGEKEDDQNIKFKEFGELSGDFFLFDQIYDKFITLYEDRKN
jgi:hypothetical protein